MHKHEQSLQSGDPAEPAPPPAQRSLASWLSGFWRAVVFLLPTGQRDPTRIHPASGSIATWIVPIGLVIGLIWVGVFRGCWRLYGETASMRPVPALAVVLVECLLTGPFLVLGLARTIHLLTGQNPLRADNDSMTPLSPVGSLALCLTVLSQWVLIVSVPTTSPWWPSESDWRSNFTFMYPAPIYRPLILAPLWGRWAIVLAAGIGKTARASDAELESLSAAIRPGRLLRYTLLPMSLTAIYCSRDQNLLLGAIIGLLVFGVTYLVSVIMARRGGGQTRQSVYASGQIGQLAFLALYRAFWPLMHG
jgi:hypothetical protein